MKFNDNMITAALEAGSFEQFGTAASYFEPTAARCSSSSSTCCVGCVQL